MEILNKRDLQQNAINHSSYTDLKVFIKIDKKMCCRKNSFLVNDTTLPSDNPLRFRKKLLKENFLE